MRHEHEHRHANGKVHTHYHRDTVIHPAPPLNFTVAHTKRGRDLYLRRQAYRLALTLLESVTLYGGADCGVVNGASRGELLELAQAIWDNMLEVQGK